MDLSTLKETGIFQWPVKEDQKSYQSQLFWEVYKIQESYRSLVENIIL